MVVDIAHLQPVVALVAGILILIMPRVLVFIVAIYLILIGVIGLGLIRLSRIRACLGGAGGVLRRRQPLHFFNGPWPKKPSLA